MTLSCLDFRIKLFSGSNISNHLLALIFFQYKGLNEELVKAKKKEH